jgi:hypothetical protein
VIEHLPSPAVEVKALARLLAPGGVLAVTTPNLASAHARLARGRWFLLKPEEHLYYFTPATLRRVLAGPGLRVAYLRASGQYQRLDFLARRVGAYAPPLGRLAERMLRGAGLAERALYVDASCVLAIATAAGGGRVRVNA